jgi:Domain of unknown function (DUF4191)
MAKKDKSTDDPENMSRRKQIVETFKMTRETDKVIGWWMLGAFLVAGAIGFTIFWILPGSGTFALIISIIGGVLFGALGAMIVFSRRAQKAAYNRLSGQAGAAARALTMLRRGWKLDEMIGFNKQQDLVHRVVGPPGIVLVGEGNPNRMRQLMLSERRRHERVASDAPIHEIVVGDGDGEVPLNKLVRHVQKLGRQIKPAEMTDVLQRLKALDAQRGKLPIPKGPVPTSMKGMRSQMRGR